MSASRDYLNYKRVPYNIDAILLDIEGTTTSVRFVKDVLFPYVLDELEHHLVETWDTVETREDVARIRLQMAIDARNSVIEDDIKTRNKTSKSGTELPETTKPVSQTRHQGRKRDAETDCKTSAKLLRTKEPVVQPTGTDKSTHDSDAESSRLETLACQTADSAAVSRTESQELGHNASYELSKSTITETADCSQSLDTDTSLTPEVAELVSVVKDMMKADRKVGCLKTLQGHMWRKGYHEGRLKGHLYPDVHPALVDWHRRGLSLYVYSSGSVEAQRLLFGNTDYGDINYLFSGNYDTGIGHKTETSSYRSIAAAIGLAPARILFVSDIMAEVRSSVLAGLQGVVCDRPLNDPGPPPPSGETYAAVSTFENIHVKKEHSKEEEHQEQQ